MVGKARYEDSVVLEWCGEQRREGGKRRSAVRAAKINSDPVLKVKEQKRKLDVAKKSRAAKKGLSTTFNYHHFQNRDTLTRRTIRPTSYSMSSSTNNQTTGLIDWTLLNAGTLATKSNIDKFKRLEAHQVIKFFELARFLMPTVDKRFGGKDNFWTWHLLRKQQATMTVGPAK